MSGSGEWCTFRDERPSKSGKTKVWSVQTAVSTDEEDLFFELGTVSWYGGWRKYAFFPAPQTLYEQDCLRQIANFCERETKMQRLTCSAAVPP